MFLNPYTNVNLFLIWPSLVLIPCWIFALPTYRLLKSQHRDDVNARATFVRAMITTEQQEELAEELEEAESHLQELYVRRSEASAKLFFGRGMAEHFDERKCIVFFLAPCD